MVLVHSNGKQSRRRASRRHNGAVLALNGRDDHAIGHVGRHGCGSGAWLFAKLRGDDSSDGAVDSGHVLLRGVRRRGERGVQYYEQLLIVRAGHGVGTSSATASRRRWRRRWRRTVSPSTAPTAPLNLQAEAGDGEVALSWEAPESDGRDALADYEFRIDLAGDWIPIGSTDLTHTVTGLTNGQTYVFEVRAVNSVGPSPASKAVEATPMAEEVILEFAHFGNGFSGNDILITSDLVLVNAAASTARPIIYFFDRAGNLLEAESVVVLGDDLEVGVDGGLSPTIGMVPLSEMTISTHGRGEVVTGSVRVVSDEPVGGLVRFDIPRIGVAGVGASQATSDALFPVRRQAGGIRTALAIHNLGMEAIDVQCLLMKNGVVLEESPIKLDANGQDALFIEELFTATDTTDFVGSVRCTVPPGGLFTGIAVEMDAGNRIFTTLPAFPIPR